MQNLSVRLGLISICLSACAPYDSTRSSWQSSPSPRSGEAAVHVPLDDRRQKNTDGEHQETGQDQQPPSRAAAITGERAEVVPQIEEDREPSVKEPLQPVTAATEPDINEDQLGQSDDDEDLRDSRHATVTSDVDDFRVDPTPAPAYQFGPQSEIKPELAHGGPVRNVEPRNSPQLRATYKPYPLMWEGKHRDAVMWSAYVMRIIGDEVGDTLLPGTADVTEFCPSYIKASRNEKINFWAALISVMAKYESGFNPKDRYMESGQGVDRVTGQATYSEGLLQLSYKDTLSRLYRNHCAFDWSKDRNLAPTDPRKTILNPLTNLKCGIHILAVQVKRRGRISVGSNAYWSVLKPTSKRIGPIKAYTRKLPFCAA